MRRTRDPVIFGLGFAALSVGLGLLLWYGKASLWGYTFDRGLLAVAGTSAIIAARGFPWQRKAVYGVLCIGGYLLVGVLGQVTGLHARAAAELGAPVAMPSVWALLYAALLVAYPLAVIVLFVGRNPELLWRRSAD